MSKKWTDEEIQFLKFAYPNKDFTIHEISKELNKSINSIKSKAYILGLKKYKEVLPKGYKKCTKCENILPITFFTKRGDYKNLYRSRCRHCMVVDNREYKQKIKSNETNGQATNGQATDVPSSKKCRDCNEVKPITEFYKNKNNKDKYDNYCKKCSSIRKEKSMLKKIQERGW